jgi:hypothetical protein
MNPWGGAAMSEHRFKIGQMVFFHPKGGQVEAPTNRPFQITARLPPTDGEPQYRVKSVYVEDEYAASERELRAVQAY